LGASVGALAAYALAVLVPALPSLYYLSRLGRWGVQAVVGEPAILWYGWLGYAGLGALLGAAVGGRLLRKTSHSWHVAWLVAIATMLLLAWNERGWFQK
jgi:ABC-type branched-subunit amino acid transport system permease subunit